MDLDRKAQKACAEGKLECGACYFELQSQRQNLSHPECYRTLQKLTASVLLPPDIGQVKACGLDRKEKLLTPIDRPHLPRRTEAILGDKQR